MTTGSLALIVFTVIVIQVVAFALFVFFRRKREMQKEGALEPLAQSVSRSIKQQPVNPPKADLAWTGAREFVVHKKVFENRSHSVCSFYLKPKDGQPLAPFLPGQFLTLNLSLPHLDGSNEMQSVFRCYSISERPRMCCYRITVKRVLPPENHPEYPPGRCSNHLFDQVNEGVSLKVNAPTGQFYLKTEVRLPIVLVGAGIGVTPILSMLSTLLDQGYTQEIWFFYGVQNGEEHIMKAYLLSLQQRYQNLNMYTYYSEPTEQDQEGVDYHVRGQIDINALKLTLPLKHYQFYVCGPGGMMNSLIPELEAWGVESEHIHYESFGPSTLRSKKASKKQAELLERIQIDFCKTGKEISWNARAESLLELAEINGIAVESGCRSGSCGSCQTRLVSGEIEYTTEPSIEVKSGHCLLCIATPKSDIVLEA